MNSEFVLVLTNVPDRDCGLALARQAVEAGLAACVNLLAPCVSIYHWQDKLESAEEIPMLIKTTRERYPALERLLRDGHPYELPEIIQVPITDGLPDYLQWLSRQTSRSCP